MPNHEHDCETCGRRATCTLPHAFTLTRSWTKAQMDAKPDFLMPFLYPAEELYDVLGEVEGCYEEVADPNGNTVWFFAGEYPLLALRHWPDGSMTLVSTDAMQAETGIAPSDTTDLAVKPLFGDMRPIEERRIRLFSFAPIDDENGNRLIIGLHRNADGLCEHDEYMFAVQGWQAYPERLAEDDNDPAPMSLDALLSMLGQALPPMPGEDEGGIGKLFG